VSNPQGMLSVEL